MTLGRRALLTLPLALSACVTDPAPVRTSFPPLRYDYLLKLPLSVATIDIAPPPPPGPLAANNPAPPADALLEMARDRLIAAGNTGRARFTIDQADIVSDNNGLDGVLSVRLEVFGQGARPVAYAEARVTRTFVGNLSDLRGTLYDMTAAMMNDMNVEFEYQVRHQLKDYLQTTADSVPPPAPVQEQPLSPPAGTVAAPPAS